LHSSYSVPLQYSVISLRAWIIGSLRRI